MTINQQPRAASDQAMWEAVLGLHTFVERQLAHTLQRRYGVGLSEYRALEVLTQAEKGECRMQELADQIGLGQSSVTRLVGRLDSAGYAYKDSCADCARATASPNLVTHGVHVLRLGIRQALVHRFQEIIRRPRP